MLRVGLLSILEFPSLIQENLLQGRTPTFRIFFSYILNYPPNSVFFVLKGSFNKQVRILN